jgi:hypothetical protein
MLLRLFAPLLGPHRNAAKELKSGKMEGTQRCFNGAPGPPMWHLATFAGGPGRLPAGLAHGRLFMKNTILSRAAVMLLVGINTGTAPAPV